MQRIIETAICAIIKQNLLVSARSQLVRQIRQMYQMRQMRQVRNLVVLSLKIRSLKILNRKAQSLKILNRIARIVEGIVATETMLVIEKAVRIGEAIRRQTDETLSGGVKSNA